MTASLSQSSFRPHTVHAPAHDALPVRRHVVAPLHSLQAVPGDIHLLEHCAFARPADREEEVERPVDQRGHAEPREERHLVDARGSEGHGAPRCAGEADDVDEDARDVRCVRSVKPAV